MTTIFAPRSLRARMAWVITLTWVATALVPQITTQSDLRHLARVGTGELARAGDEAGPSHVDADGGIEAGIALGVASRLMPSRITRPIVPA